MNCDSSGYPRYPVQNPDNHRTSYLTNSTNDKANAAVV